MALASFAWNLLFKIKYDTLQYIQNVNYSKSLRFAITECKSCSAFYETAFFGMGHLSLIVKNNFQIKALNQGTYVRKGRGAGNSSSSVAGRELSEPVSGRGNESTEWQIRGKECGTVWAEERLIPPSRA